ncbi:PxKF domain-containing protein [Candidatus Parcubacteria bacterium]|nr:PxKF domain-containing protein [Candidatus Parcubacteria bacterium]
MNFKKIIAITIAVSVSGLLPAAIALADTITNDVVVGIASNGDTIVNGGSTTVTYQLNQVNGVPVGDVNGCDVNNSNPASAVISVVGATANPSNFQFTSCGNGSLTPIVFTSTNAGDHPVTISVTGGKAGSLYQTSSANWTLHVQALPTDVTKPVITGTRLPLANVNGWNNTNVAVSFTCADELGGSGVNVNTVAGDNMTLTGESAGQSVSSDGVCTDVAGNVAITPVTVGSINIDKTAPTIVASITGGTLGTNGWYVSDVTVHYTCADSLSGVVSCPVDVVLSTEGSSVSAPTPTVMDLAGNTSDPSNLVTVKIDKTGPTANLVVTGGTLGNNSWYTSDVTVSTVGTDAVSSPVVCSADQYQTVETAGVVFNGSCTNDAGLTTNALPLTVMLDKTAPVVTLTTPAINDQFLQNSVVNANWSVSDALSGIDGGSTTATAPNGSPINTSTTGAYVFMVSATDMAGNTTSVSHNYTVYTYVFGGLKAPVSLSMKEFKQGSTIPVKFQVFNSVTGLPVQGPAATLKVNLANAIASGGSNVLNNFRYDATAQQYIYNLSTKSLSVGPNLLNVYFASNPPANPVAITIIIK